MPDRYDVAVVGCGPVGALGAALLARAGFRTLVVDRADDVYDGPRAIHFDAQIMRLLQQIGIADELEPLLRPWHRSVFTGADGELLRTHEFPVEQVEGWPPHLLFYQPELERLLRRALVEHGAELRLATELVDLDPGPDDVALTVRADGAVEQLRAGWLIGCDGASSAVRKALGIPLEDMRFDEPWLVVDAIVEDQASLPRESRMVCDPRRPSTLIEGRGAHRRWELMVLPHEDPVAIAEPHNVSRLLAEWIDPGKVTIVRAAVYRFHGLVASAWRRGRAFLAGDAAHQTPPFLGQGMCHGMRDVSNLAWKLAAVAAGRADSSLLDTYEAERKPHVTEIIALSVASGRDICILDPEAAAARDRAVREQAARQALPQSPFVGMPPLRHGLLGGGAGAGFLFPQPRVEVDGSPHRLDDVIGARWAVVVDGELRFDLSDHDRARLDRLDAKLLRVGGGRDQTDGVQRVVDPAAVVRRWMDARSCRAAVVRPDRYTYATADTVNEALAEVASLSVRRGEGADQTAAATRT